MVTKQEGTVVAHSIRIVCTGPVVAFTVGLGPGAASGIVADRPAFQLGFTDGWVWPEPVTVQTPDWPT